MGRSNDDSSDIDPDRIGTHESFGRTRNSSRIQFASLPPDPSGVVSDVSGFPDFSDQEESIRLTEEGTIASQKAAEATLKESAAHQENSASIKGENTVRSAGLEGQTAETEESIEFQGALEGVTEARLRSIEMMGEQNSLQGESVAQTEAVTGEVDGLTESYKNLAEVMPTSLVPMGQDSLVQNGILPWMEDYEETQVRVRDRFKEIAEIGVNGLTRALKGNIKSWKELGEIAIETLGDILLKLLETQSSPGLGGGCRRRLSGAPDPVDPWHRGSFRAVRLCAGRLFPGRRGRRHRQPARRLSRHTGGAGGCAQARLHAAG